MISAQKYRYDFISTNAYQYRNESYFEIMDSMQLKEGFKIRNPKNLNS